MPEERFQRCNGFQIATTLYENGYFVRLGAPLGSALEVGLKGEYAGIVATRRFRSQSSHRTESFLAPGEGYRLIIALRLNPLTRADVAFAVETVEAVHPADSSEQLFEIARHFWPFGESND